MNRECADPGKIRNPATGRCVSRTGVIGRKVQADRNAAARGTTGAPNIPTKKECKKQCEPDKICNPASGRCVSRTGAIGRKLVPQTANRTMVPPRPAPEEPVEEAEQPLDPITLEPINTRHLYVMNKQPYDVRSLAEIVDRARFSAPRVPHSRRNMSLDERENILRRARNAGWTSSRIDAVANGGVAISDGARLMELKNAIIDGDVQRVRELIRQYPALVNPPGRRWPPLHNAANLNYVEIVDALLEAGADPNFVDDNGNTALVYAFRRFDPDAGRSALKTLLDAGADPNQPVDRGFTPIIFALQQYPKVVPILLAYGANPNTMIPRTLRIATAWRRNLAPMSTLAYAMARPPIPVMRYREDAELLWNYGARMSREEIALFTDYANGSSPELRQWILEFLRRAGN